MKKSLISLILFTSPAWAQHQLELYLGQQAVSSHRVSGVDVNGDELDFRVTWEGRSWQAPLYYGGRYSYKFTKHWSAALNFTHSKAYATDESRAESGFPVMEFTDGLNPITLNGIYNFAPAKKFEAYLGAGVGMAIPYVELQSPNMTQPEYSYQWTGPAFQALLGTRYLISDHWFFMVEYSYHWIKVDVNMGEGGRYETDFQTHAVNLGGGYRF